MTDISQGDREKQSAAGNSLLTAIGLAGIKTVVGLMTGSLGILAEAAHSGLDLVAAIMTFLDAKTPLYRQFAGLPQSSVHCNVESHCGWRYAFPQAHFVGGDCSS